MLSLNFHVLTNVGLLCLVTPADSMNVSLGMGFSIASKLEGECLYGWVVVMVQWSEHWPAAIVRGPGFDSQWLPRSFSSSNLAM